MLSVIVPSWNHAPSLAHMTAANLTRVREVATVPTEILLVDNGSTHKATVPVDAAVYWTTNRGIGPAWNEGARMATGDVLCFLNTDVTVQPGWDRALMAAALDGPRVAFPYTDYGDGRYRQPDGGVAGWCWAVSRATFDKVGLLDETFVPAWYEDTDWFHRADALGIPLSPVPAARVRHIKSQSAKHPTAGLKSWECLFWSQRFRYAWKHGVDPNDIPPFYKRAIQDYLVA